MFIFIISVRKKQEKKKNRRKNKTKQHVEPHDDANNLNQILIKVHKLVQAKFIEHKYKDFFLCT